MMCMNSRWPSARKSRAMPDMRMKSHAYSSSPLSGLGFAAPLIVILLLHHKTQHVNGGGNEKNGKGNSHRIGKLAMVSHGFRPEVDDADSQAVDRVVYDRRHQSHLTHPKGRGTIEKEQLVEDHRSPSDYGNIHNVN